MKESIEKLIEEGERFNHKNFAKGRSQYTDEVTGLGYPTSFDPSYVSWRNRAQSAINRAYTSEDNPTRSAFQIALSSDKTLGNGVDEFRKSHDVYLGCLKSLLDEHELGLVSDPKNTVSTADSPLHIVELLCKRFHKVAVQLRRRYDERNSLDIDDEYDVQDLLHALLKLYFDDVRPEDYVPSESGANSRIDFIIEGTGIGIEVKKTRKGLNDKKIGEELLIDVARYEKHPKCNHLICFVYDPEERIVNPKGLEKDLSEKSREGFDVKVIVSPER